MKKNIQFFRVYSVLRNSSNPKIEGVTLVAKELSGENDVPSLGAWKELKNIFNSIKGNPAMFICREPANTSLNLPTDYHLKAVITGAEGIEEKWNLEGWRVK